MFIDIKKFCETIIFIAQSWQTTTFRSQVFTAVISFQCAETQTLWCHPVQRYRFGLAWIAKQLLEINELFLQAEDVITRQLNIITEHVTSCTCLLDSKCCVPPRSLSTNLKPPLYRSDEGVNVWKLSTDGMETDSLGLCWQSGTYI